ncbi:hypothetical protein [Microbacterium aurugineum]|uniref:hypothetical protein n=1 Tax=Microbacterium aurugineum TaxID=2851642 RepID=UPI0020BE80CF|nr:hypothetical protein [Microbacterium aurugineum]MCK8476034.1 hypothetical protein [Microbacterium aurugineum]
MSDQSMELNECPPELRRLVDRFAPGWPPILEVSPGWYPLLARLDTRLSAIAPGYVLQQCKSKFGSLSFYASPSDDPSDYNEEFNETIRAAEWESIETCEECGADGAQYVIHLWVSTLCPEHHKARTSPVDGDSR